MKAYLFIFSFVFCSISFAQNKITGLVTDKSKQPIFGANIKIVGHTEGAVSDVDGKFELSTSQKIPLELEISSLGYATQILKISSVNQKVNVALLDQETTLNEIVISASRTPERVIESPVTIERMGIQQIKNTTAVTFYDGLENLKEVHFNTSSMSFKSVNTRGFAAVNNTRFMQLVDGMDNSSPALNFVLGNLIGLSELDVANVELLPGASSALYGANAFNGILFMNSKSPFTNQGISTYMKYGQTTQKTAGTNDYYDFGIRAATAFSKHFAGKANLNIMRGTEWMAADTRNVVNGNVIANPNAIGHGFNPNYDGLNVYGDEVTTNIKDVGKSLASLGVIPPGAENLLPNSNVSRTGYDERALLDNKVESVKADFSLHIKPWANDIEIILQHKVGLGNTIFQSANRYALKNFFMNQTRAEIKGNNFFLRAYLTTEDAGDSYDTRFAGWNVNRAWSSDNTWFGEYAGTFIQSTLAGLTPDKSHAAARQFADRNRYVPGSPEFNSALATITQDADFTKGAKFQDNSKIWHADGNYNFKELTSFAEIQLGGSARQYEMNSNGSIFTDYDGPLKYTEFGVYTQVQKRFLEEDRLKFTGSIRYDKSKNFEGNFSPRVSLVYSAGESKKHNFRASYQTGFRNPTTQDQYIGLDLGPFALIGSAPENLDRFTEIRNISFTGQQSPSVSFPTGGGQPATVTMTGQNAYRNSFTSASVQAFAAAPKTTPAEAQAAANLLKAASPGLVKPERVMAFELGYRSVIKDFSVDINGYYNVYNDFLNSSNVIAPYYGDVNTVIDFTNPATLAAFNALANGDRRVYQVYTNSKAEISSVGFGLGLSKKVYKDFEAGINYNYADFQFDQADDPGFEAGFNTPKHRIKASIGNSKLFKNFGFNVNVRWNTEYLWQSSFVDGYVPENTVLDAQINYGIPAIKSVIKIGATNLFGEDYIQVLGAGAIGQQVYASLTINP
jgi:outer membrane receptor protein involved in Fe transport